MLVTRTADLAQRCRVMRLHGIDRDVFNRYQTERPAWYYEVIAPGFKYNMPDIAAAIGLVQLSKIYDLHNRRMKIAQRYDEAFNNLPVTLPPRPDNYEDHAWHLYVLRLRDDASVERDTFIEEMSCRGIGTSVHFIPLHLHPYWRNRYGFKPEDFPVALDCYRRSVSLPIYSKMTNDDIEMVIKAVRTILT
jgi:dTDP-4-amino-4,6-dideoxygalactose transaminase